MKYFALISKNFGITLLSIIIMNIIVTILSYFNILSDSIISFFQIFIIVLSLFIGGVLTGKESNKKGWLEGIKFGIFICIIFFFINLIFIKNIEWKNFIYYIILIISSMVGGMIGITKKASN